MQEDKQLVRVFRNTYEYTTVEVKADEKNPEQLVQGLISSGVMKFNDSETVLIVIPERGLLNEKECDDLL